MYLLDANSYIEAKNRYYQMSFCPAYWDWLDQQYTLGTLASISSVYDEVARKGDDLSTWVQARPHQFLAVSAPAIQSKMTEVAQHVADLPNKDSANVANFLSGADPWLIAVAALHDETIVTHEALTGANSKKIKIPNICNHFGVRYINTFELLNELSARFMLDNTTV